MLVLAVLSVLWEAVWLPWGILGRTNKTEKTENIQSADLSKEKEEVVKEKKKEKDTVIKQKKITTVKFIGKTLEELIKEFGEPVLVRKDGNTQTIRFDTSSCRLFIYFDSK